MCGFLVLSPFETTILGIPQICHNYVCWPISLLMWQIRVSYEVTLEKQSFVDKCLHTWFMECSCTQHNAERIMRTMSPVINHLA